MKKQSISIALVLGAICLSPLHLQAASCCGGGSGAALVLPKMKSFTVGTTLSHESYTGFWDAQQQYKPDPAGSKLSQTRLSIAAAKRLNDNWQMALAIPYVWNDNQYASNTFKTNGVGDSTLSITYEAFDDITCTWVLDTLEDYKPAMYFGAALTIPTGISPYDDVANNFDITGRGFYRLDIQALIEKTVYPWNASVGLNYGKHLKRSINRESGVYVAPYTKTLGDRVSSSLSLGYTIFMKAGDTLTLTGAYADLQEKKSTIDGEIDETSGMRKRGFSGTAAWATEDKNTVVKATYAYTPRYHNWGRNFPTTNTISLGVNYVYD